MLCMAWIKNERGDWNMLIKKILVMFMLFMAALAVLSVKSQAEDGLEGSVTIGGAAVDLDGKSFKYGEYTGIKDNGAYFAGDADLSYNMNAWYLDFRTKNVGLDNRSLYLEEGVYGRYKFFLGYDELPKLISNNSKTPFIGEGSTNLTLPSGFVRGSTAALMTSLGSNRHDIELETQRKSGEAGFSGTIGDADFKVSFKRETKEGTKSIGSPLGIDGGTTRGVVLPEPVDYTTDELRASLAYTGETAQIQFDYYLSAFDNAKESITWDNPFYFTGTGYTLAQNPTTAKTSLPPDNQHQRVSLSGGINLPLATRISAIAEYGIMEQDEILLPYSNNPNTTITAALPRNTADAEIDTTHIGLNISSRLISRLGISARYRYYSTDNATQRTLFQYVKNDTGGAAQAGLNSNWAAYNLPYDSTQNQVKVDASYYLFSGAALKIGYDHDIVDRNYREVETTKENTYRARLNSSLSSFASAGMNYSYAERRGGQYEESRLYDAMHTQEYINTVAANLRFDNLPDLRKFDIANRDRTKYGADISFFMTPNTTVGLYYNYMLDDYYESLFGLQKSENKSYTVDATYTPAEFISTYAYCTREELKSRQASRDYTTVGGEYAQSININNNWRADHDEDINTIGVGVNLGFMENKLTIGADYAYSESTGTIKFLAGSGTNVAGGAGYRDMPELQTKLQTVNTSAKYKFTKNVAVGLGYQYENYKSDDWATDGVDPASATAVNVLTLSGSVPDYEAHTGMIFVTYNFGI
ncbi:MAG: hypothetical protein A3G39_07195 [Deltaproteobacteria bacterium RIFCSPLOWO2_12_FULL_43_16]|nr:MAG: hypothetical protein A2Z89_06370 [Deltaproteobacteria bacterium GWA2_43_19]OGQ11028.1 MAG: hypothetical protein A3D30_06955 [Deltaproteobacteria bacterium RIFCSPHIGHO2_02_FULL_43_33]OGQ61861.1 MAG: hypothetical protein A3G39_07195 [Deltaproteobacteria bacterium RIFCSPLOWO2_12_FULL_43_16]HBR16026.1 hypothetical protein [Deltaproteobacteria bacterium]